MPQFCSCGAELPPDARFCHKCGKPQGPEPELVFEQPIELEPAFQPAPPPRPAALNFHNPVAVRVGFGMASLAALLSWLSAHAMGPFVSVWWLAAGFTAVYVYRRRTGQTVNTSSGVRLGWITGVLTSAIMAVLSTISVLLVAFSKEGFAGAFQQAMPSASAADPNMQAVIRMLQSPAGLFTVLALGYLVLFFFITVLSTAGGALGATLGGRER